MAAVVCYSGVLINATGQILMTVAYFNIRQKFPDLTPAQCWILAGRVSK